MKHSSRRMIGVHFAVLSKAADDMAVTIANEAVVHHVVGKGAEKLLEEFIEDARERIKR